MVLTAAGDGEKTTRVPPKTGPWYSHTGAGKASYPFPPFSQGGWQPCGMLAKVAVVFLKLVIWGSCFQAEGRPWRDLRGSQMPCSSVHLPLCLYVCELIGLACLLRHGGEEEWELLAVFPEVSGDEAWATSWGPPLAMWCPAPRRLPKEVRFKTSNVGHAAWGLWKADRAAHPPL